MYTRCTSHHLVMNLVFDTSSAQRRHEECFREEKLQEIIIKYFIRMNSKSYSKKGRSYYNLDVCSNAIKFFWD